MKKYLCLSFILVLSSCISIPDKNKNMTEFIIENKSSSPIKKIICTTSYAEKYPKEFQVFDQINSGESISGFIPESVHKFNGEYILKFTRINGKSERIRFGYYDGNIFYYSHIKFEIHDDSKNNIISGVPESFKFDCNNY